MAVMVEFLRRREKAFAVPKAEGRARCGDRARLVARV
jgi:hypothetical protein